MTHTSDVTRGHSGQTLIEQLISLGEELGGVSLQIRRTDIAPFADFTVGEDVGRS